MGRLGSSLLKPGEQGTLAVLVDTSGRAGTLTKFVTIETNDRLNPRFSFVLTVDVAPKGP